MKKVSQIAAIVALGTACAMPVMAQDSSSSTTPSATTSSTPSTTQSMGAGPESMDRQDDGHRDMGWIGLLGLAGLLGLRRKHHHDDHIDTRRTTTAR